MRSLIVFAALALMMVAMPGTAAAQEPATPPAATGQVDQAAAPPATPAAPQSTGLPERTAQARTMRAYWHVFIAFAATWLLLFGYALTVGRRFGRLEEEIQRMRGSA
jgi:CcmD family protein